MRESQLLAHIFQHNPALPADVVIPPGDDLGAVRIGPENGGQVVLVGVDQVADGVHVDVANTPLELVGRKAMTRNLSDIAAMAARPVGAVASAMLPRDFGEAGVNQLFDAMRATGEAYGCPLIGGDVGMWDKPLVISVTVFAEPASVEPVLRSGAKPGDAVFVTGTLGQSFESGHHLKFEPRLSVARRLAGDAMTRPTAMIDLSDGLARDLGHICEQSEVAAMIDDAALPYRDSTARDWRKAVGDGEDYELCFTISADRAANVPGDLEGVTITRIGKIEPANREEAIAQEPRVRLHLSDGSLQWLDNTGWEHHA